MSNKEISDETKDEQRTTDDFSTSASVEANPMLPDGMCRKLIDITIEEVIQLLRLSEGWHPNTDYKMKIVEGNSLASRERWVRVYYEWDNEEKIVMNISDTKNAISICSGNTYYRTIYRIVKYLQDRGFDLEAANSCG